MDTLLALKFSYHLRILKTFEQGTPLFHFALDPTSYIADPVSL